MKSSGKVCSKCKVFRPLHEFGKQKDQRDGLRPNCKKCRSLFYKLNRERIKGQRKKHRDKIGWEGRRNNNLKASYGISLDDFNQLLEKQGYKCSLCHTDEPGHKYGWHLDHDHETDGIRAILCYDCNLKLGHLENFLKKVSFNEIQKYLNKEDR